MTRPTPGRSKGFSSASVWTDSGRPTADYVSTTVRATPTGASWSYTNDHGDVITTTNQAGDRVWTGYSGPYGEQAVTTTPANSAMPGTSYGWHGDDGRFTDHTLTPMGARAYTAVLGRFLSVDPIEGGCANAYTYVTGDPVNQDDVTGEGFWGKVKKIAKKVAPIAAVAGVCAITATAGCAIATGIALGVQAGVRAYQCGVGKEFWKATAADAAMAAIGFGVGYGVGKLVVKGGWTTSWRDVAQALVRRGAGGLNARLGAAGALIGGAAAATSMKVRFTGPVTGTGVIITDKYGC